MTSAFQMHILGIDIVEATIAEPAIEPGYFAFNQRYLESISVGRARTKNVQKVYRRRRAILPRNLALQVGSPSLLPIGQPLPVLFL